VEFIENNYQNENLIFGQYFNCAIHSIFNFFLYLKKKTIKNYNINNLISKFRFLLIYFVTDFINLNLCELIENFMKENEKELNNK
jgi:hypothetical protein